MKATEETLEQELARTFEKELQADVVSQPRAGPQKPDLLLRFNDMRIVLELKVGRPARLIDAVVQAYGYFTGLGLDGILVVVFPESSRRTITHRNDVIDIINNAELSAIFLSQGQSKYFDGVNIRALTEWLRFAIRPRVVEVDLGLLTHILKESVETISLELKRSKGVARPALDLVINRFDLFSALSSNEPASDAAKKRDLTAVACDLASYILVNQILLYTLLTKPLNLPQLNAIHKAADLTSHFARVMEVDYRAVFYVDVSSHLPPSTVFHINNIIYALSRISIDSVQHGLLGRLFHECLPFKTRKELATFYTKPVAAEILAVLAIDNARTTVLDAACGSGTLLVSAYRRKKVLDPNFPHKDILEKEIYGLDIMPFAAHLAALNLTIQNLSEVTDAVNIGVGNALFLQEGYKIQPQVVLFPIHLKQVDLNAESSRAFVLPIRVDLVLMNPPFTDRKRITESMLGDFKEEFKRPQNYWAYFVKLADYFLETNGRFAAVLPRLFLSGSFSKELRKWLFHEKRYTLRTIVKTTKEIAFSESARFRDYLVILDKGWSNTPCAFVELKASTDRISLDEAEAIAARIRTVRPGSKHRDSDFNLRWVTQSTISTNWRNIGALFAFEQAESTRWYSLFWDRALKEESALTTLDQAKNANIIRGFEPKPRTLYQYTFFVRPLHKGRIQHSKLIIQGENKNTLRVYDSALMKKMEIKKSALTPALKTASYIPNFIVDGNVDYALINSDDPDYVKKIAKSYKFHIDSSYLRDSTKKRLTNLLVVKRVNLAAPGTHFVAFYNDVKMISTNVFYSVIVDPDYAKALSVWLNSTIGILQFLSRRMETKGSYCDLLLETLRADFLVPSRKSISAFSSEINNFLKAFRGSVQPSLIDQLASKGDFRRELDLMALKMIGIEGDEAATWAEKLQQALLNELTALKSLMRGKSAAIEEDLLDI